MKDNKTKKVGKIALIGVAMATVTAIAGVGAWAAAQNTLTATETIAFVADPWVDAVVTDIKGGTSWTFVSTDKTDDSQTGNFYSIADADWEEVADSIKEKYVLEIKIENTSAIETNKLTYTISNNFNTLETYTKGYCTLDSVNATGVLGKDESATAKFTFTADGLHDFSETIQWTVQLTASNNIA